MTGKKTKAGALRWLRPDYRVPRLARPGETARQIEAALIAPDAKSSKPSYPAGDNVAPTAAVLAALARMG
ncbi:MAG TPA: hypothetical protein DEP84_22380, partial [Chloroflexi bacterium]|nr:hypothetical protein [Chloroflexota bacterium]